MALNKAKRNRDVSGSRATARTLRPACALAAAGLPALFAAIAAAKPPPLPTPCLAGNCGTSAQSFVQYGAASATFSGTTVNIAQSTSKAILNWANFNIANGYAVNFIQPNATAAVLNDIWSAN